MNVHKNARLTPAGRDLLAQRVDGGRILRRLGLGELAALEPRQPDNRYEREAPGELIHLDIKSLGRIDGIGHRITGDRSRRKRRIGWDHLHVAIDDSSRLA